MKLSLRKANTLQISINDVIKSVNLVTEVTLNEFVDAEATLSQAAVKFKADLARKDALYVALYEIRKAVSVANSNAGIDMRLADIAALDKQITSYNALAGSSVRKEKEVIEGSLNKIRNRKEDSRLYGYGENVTSSFFEELDIKYFKDVVSKAKKAKQKLQDELLELNVRTEIVLSEKTVQTLIGEGLV